MRTEDDDVASLESDQRFIDRGRSGIRRRDDGGDHANGTGNLKNLLFLVLADTPMRNRKCSILNAQ